MRRIMIRGWEHERSGNVKEQRELKEQTRISANLRENEKYLRTRLENCSDILIRPMRLGENHKVDCLIVYIEVAVSNMMLDDSAIGKMINHFWEISPDQIQDFVQNNSLGIADVKKLADLDEAVEAMLTGDAVFFIDGYDKAMKISSKGYPSMGVMEAESEKVLRGSREGFSDSVKSNSALVRKRLRDTRLKVEEYKIGVRSHTLTQVLYMDDLVRPELLEKIRNKVKKMSFDGIFDGGMVEQLLEENRWTPFPQFQHTERPDKAASGLLEGRIALVVDNSPGVLLLPVTYQMFFQAGDDYYTRFAVASFARLLRFAASLFAIGFPGLYVAIAAFHTEMLPTSFLLSIATARTGIVIPVALEVLLMEFQFELLKEAGIHLPGQLGGTIGIVGGLIVGQAAVEAGIVSTIVVIVVAFTAIASFIVPNESFGSVFRLLKFLFIITAAVWGIYGYLLTFTALLLHLSQLESFGVPYMQPSVCGENLNYDDKKDHYVRYPFAYMRKRPVFTREGRRIRKK